MLTTEQPWTSTAAVCAPAYELRMHGGTEDERLISIPIGKHSVGSGPRCSLRLELAGVQPMECLIVHDATGLRVRRWSENALFNGQPFDDAWLAPGDVLTLGPLELEVVTPLSDAVGTDELATESVAESWGPGDRKAAEFAAPAIETNVESNARPEPSESLPADDPVSEHNNSSANARRRNRRVQEYLRRQRQEHAELVARIDELKKCVELAIGEPATTGHLPPETSQVSLAENEARFELDQRSQALESELVGVRDQLATRDQELSQARFSIDALERQLIDSQHTMHAFAEERLTWEQQFNELESRLAEYVGRIQELERHLDQVCEARSENGLSSPAVTTDAEGAATVETAVESTSDTVEAIETASADNDLDIRELGSQELGSQEDVEEPSWNPPAESRENSEVQETTSADASEFAVDVSEPPAEAPAEIVDEGVIDQDDNSLDHASGVAIWREEPEDAAEEGDGAPEKSFSEPASFLDRYAHLFANEVEGTPPPAHPEPSKPAAIVAPDAETPTDEESVEQYMAKLLERMRGSSDEPAQAEKKFDQPTKMATPAESVDVASDPLVDEQPSHEPITELAELKSKVGVPELASDRRAMRELANQSARQAISVHTARKLRRTARAGFLKAVVGGSIGGYLMLIAPEWQTLQFVAGCVAIMAALYWGTLTLSTMIQGVRVGAFDDAEESEDEAVPETAVCLPLPIDIERNADEQTADERSDDEPSTFVHHPEPHHARHKS